MLADTAVVGHLGRRAPGRSGGGQQHPADRLRRRSSSSPTGPPPRWRASSAPARRARPPTRRSRACGWPPSPGSSSPPSPRPWPARCVALLGAEGAVRTEALLYLRISLVGVPAMLVVLAGTGYLRGLQDTRTPLVVAVVSALRQPGARAGADRRARASASAPRRWSTVDRPVGVGGSSTWCGSPGPSAATGWRCGPTAAPCGSWPWSAATCSSAPPPCGARCCWPPRWPPASAPSTWPPTRSPSRSGRSWPWCSTPSPSPASR